MTSKTMLILGLIAAFGGSDIIFDQAFAAKDIEREAAEEGLMTFIDWLFQSFENLFDALSNQDDRITDLEARVSVLENATPPPPPELVCGDSIVSPELGEQCDDGNLVNGDGCSDLCQVENILCGNGIVDYAFGEQCDDGNPWNGDGCSNTCQIEEPVLFCGDSIVSPELGEQCDDGNTENSDNCTNQCTTAVCGDGFVSLSNGEQCDDGNAVNGDGCTSTCMIETGSLLGTWVGEYPLTVSCSDGMNAPLNLDFVRFEVNDVNGDDEVTFVFNDVGANEVLFKGDVLQSQVGAGTLSQGWNQITGPDIGQDMYISSQSPTQVDVQFDIVNSWLTITQLGLICDSIGNVQFEQFTTYTKQ